MGDATLLKRIFYSDDVVRKEGALAHALQKIDVSGALHLMLTRCGPRVIPPPPPPSLLSTQEKFLIRSARKWTTRWSVHIITVFW